MDPKDQKTKPEPDVIDLSGDGEEDGSRVELGAESSPVSAQQAEEERRIQAGEIRNESGEKIDVEMVGEEPAKDSASFVPVDMYEALELMNSERDSLFGVEPEGVQPQGTVLTDEVLLDHARDIGATSTIRMFSRVLGHLGYDIDGYAIHRRSGRAIKL